MDYELFHDESNIAGYWHGILLVPVEKKTNLVNLLDLSRKESSYKESLSIKKVKKKGVIYGCAYSWVTIGVASLASSFRNFPPQIYMGERNFGKREYCFMPELIGAKFILFCERDSHQLMVNYPDHASKIETTFRMGLKGGLHFLGCEENPINITGIHFDGYKHYSRHVDKSRIVSRLNGLRDYCSILNTSELIDDRSSDHNRSDSQDYCDCQLLQLTDLLVGSFRTILGEMTNQIHYELAQPVLPLIIKYQKGYARMRNSRWWSSFCMSQCFLDSNSWVFDTLDLWKKEESQQMILPGLDNQIEK